MSRILPVFHQRGNRELISRWIRTKTTHEAVEITEGDDPFAVEFDLCLIDGPSFSTHREALTSHLSEVHPEFLPVLLLIKRERAHRLTDDIWEHVDDIIWTSGGGRIDSIDTFEFKGRLKSLLRKRQLSLDLIDNQERLKVLHRVLRHNLRNSMNVISGTAALIDNPEENPDVRRIIQTCDRLLHHADNARSIDQLFQRDTQREIDLEQQLSRCVQSYELEYPEAVIELDIASPTTVTGAEVMPGIFEEILHNAITHNPDEHPEVWVKVNQENGYGVVSVEDTGPPIPSSDLAIIDGELDPSPIDHGSGLGLWLLAWAIHRSDGEIDHQPRDTGGNRITIRLPAVEQ